MPEVQEFRRNRRVESSQLSMGLYDDGRRMPDVAITDLSVTGMGMTVQDRLSEGQELEYSVVLPGGEVKGRAVVRWIQPYHLGYKTGVEFQKLGFWDRFRLGRYVGDGFKISLPSGAMNFFDNFLILGSLTVGLLVLLDAIGVQLNDLLELALFFVWQ